jgi:hypothetical protein
MEGRIVGPLKIFWWGISILSYSWFVAFTGSDSRRFFKKTGEISETGKIYFIVLLLGINYFVKFTF